MGFLKSALKEEHLEWLRSRLTVVSIPFKDQEPTKVEAFYEGNDYFWVPRYFDHMDFWPKIKAWNWVAPELDYPLESRFIPDPAREQPEALEAMEAHLRQHSGGIGVLPTSVGKTYLALEVARRFKTPIGVLIYAGHMIDNWVEHCESHLGIPECDVGIVKENRCDIGKPVTIISVQTVLARDLPQEVFDHVGFLIMDECLTGDTLIETDVGRVRIDSIPSSGASSVLCYDEELEQWTFRRIKRWLNQGVRRVVRVTTAEGQALRCTANHPLLTQRGWVEAGNLQQGDKILSPAVADAASHSHGSTRGVAPSDSGFQIPFNGSDSSETNQGRLAWTTSFQTITSVEDVPLPGERVYDLEIEEHHNFVANGLLVHNCHHFGAKMWSTVLAKFPARYRLGMSANPLREDGLDPVIRWNIGKVAYARYKRDNVDELPLVCLVRYPAQYKESRYKDWKQDDSGAWVASGNNSMKYDKVLMKDTKRNDWLVSKIMEARSKGRSIIIFARHRKHIQELHDKFSARWKKAMADVSGSNDTTKAMLLVGGQSKKKRKEASSADVIFTTHSYAREALNLTHLDTMIFATPVGDPLQPAGRLRDRGPKDRKSLLIVDVHEGNDYSFNKALRRKTAYETLGMTVRRHAKKAV